MLIRFWGDTWLEETPLAKQYSILYNIMQRKKDYLGTVFQLIPLNIQFRRLLVGERWNSWMHLVRRLIDVQLSDQPDSFHWKLARNGVFTVKSFYMDLIDFGPIPRSIHIWKVKVPLRIKFFMRFVHKQMIPIKDNLPKRRWVSSTWCCFYDHDETIQHLFIDCSRAKLLWKRFI